MWLLAFRLVPRQAGTAKVSAVLLEWRFWTSYFVPESDLSARREGRVSDFLVACMYSSGVNE